MEWCVVVRLGADSPGSYPGEPGYGEPAIPYATRQRRLNDADDADTEETRAAWLHLERLRRTACDEVGLYVEHYDVPWNADGCVGQPALWSADEVRSQLVAWACCLPVDGLLLVLLDEQQRMLREGWRRYDTALRFNESGMRAEDRDVLAFVSADGGVDEARGGAIDALCSLLIPLVVRGAAPPALESGSVLRAYI